MESFFFVQGASIKAKATKILAHSTKMFAD